MGSPRTGAGGSCGPGTSSPWTAWRTCASADRGAQDPSPRAELVPRGTVSSASARLTTLPRRREHDDGSTTTGGGTVTTAEPLRAPIRVPRWPAAAEPTPPDFAAIRAGLGGPGGFPAGVLAGGGGVVRGPPLPEVDPPDVGLVPPDPQGSRDLDQAVHLARRGNGYRVSYAIADVGAFVRLGSALDREARRRGQTLYSPDRRGAPPPPAAGGGAARPPPPA